MQGIDFKNIVRKQNSGERMPASKPEISQHLHRATYSYGKIANLSLLVLAFSIGMFSGMQWQKQKMTRQMEHDILNPKSVDAATEGKAHLTENQVAHNTANQTENQAIEADSVSIQKTENSQKTEPEFIKSDPTEDTFLVMAKRYKDKTEAHSKALMLKKAGLPVFMAESGSYLKVYVGPLKGKNYAYSILARVKRAQEFKGAILYKR